MAEWRKMRRHGQQMEDAEVEEVLRSGMRGTLAVLGDDGYPYTVVLDYVHEPGHLYFHTAPVGHKLDALDACDKASFSVIEADPRPDGQWWYTWRSVVAFGRVRRVDDPAEVERTLRAVGEKYFPPEESVDEEVARTINRVVMLDFKIEHVTGKRVREK